MKFLLPILILISPLCTGAESGKVFSFHLFSEPTQLDPQLTSSASGTYLVTNLFRGLFRYRSDKGLILEMAKSCERSPLTLRCTLKDNATWSDGKPVVASDFVRAFQKLIDPKNKSLSADGLFHLKNARDIWAGKAAPSSLGVVAENEKQLRFDFAQNDFEFEYKLIHPAMSPRREENQYKGANVASLIVNGPYKIVRWNPGHEVRLTSNNYYDTQARPDVEVYFIDNDSTALRLFETGKLTFDRRVVASEIPRFQKRPEFFQIPMARFDFIGFGPKLKEFPKVREALSKSVDFASFHKLFDSKGLPGCPSLPRKWLDKMPCLKQDVPLAKKVYQESGVEASKLDWQFGISQLGGEDIARAAEWFQGQWSKNLGVKIPISPMEQATYLQRLRINPPAIFRKGAGLDRPTCAAALEMFTAQSPENYIQFNDPEYDRIFQQLLQTTKPELKQQLCRRAVERLLSGYSIIPLGEMHFSVLASTRFKGWHINEINQLDLTDLRRVQ